MKKLLFVLMSLALLASQCKKNPGGGGGNEHQTYECMPQKLTFTDTSGTETITYRYEENRIKSKDRTFSDGTTLTYNYYYNDPQKGLLDRIDILYNGNVIARFNYTIENEHTTKTELVVLNNNQWITAIEYYYTYNNQGKVATKRIVDHDYWGDFQNPTDETGVYTYTGDNATNIKWYNTDDMNTIKEEYTLEYDQGKQPFANVVTQTYPATSVNNIIHVIHQIYQPAPSTIETFTHIDYNQRNFPVKYQETDDRDNLLNTEEVEYSNCQ